jgi:hypothetical protein
LYWRTASSTSPERRQRRAWITRARGGGSGKLEELLDDDGDGGELPQPEEGRRQPDLQFDAGGLAGERLAILLGRLGVPPQAEERAREMSAQREIVGRDLQGLAQRLDGFIAGGHRGQVNSPYP